MNATPTEKVYGELDKAYDILNQELFGGELPTCLLTLNRKKNAYGYFCPGIFGRLDPDRPKPVDEIALNPQHMNLRTPLDALGTLAHEMVHQWQEHFGSPSKSIHHNGEWKEKMRSVGLEPVGKGDKVSHVIVEGGVFHGVAIEQVLPVVDLEGVGDTLTEHNSKPKRKSGAYSKYTCSTCNSTARAKADMDLRCGDHGQMIETKPKQAAA